jgi:regulator of sirC expression with transglutaminase-like and TPR domain
VITEEKQIKSIISLLDDEDERAYKLLENEVISIGAKALPFLKDALDESLNDLKTTRLNLLFRQINLSKTIEDLSKWRNSENKNLYEALLIISKFQYPNLDVDKISKIINKLRQDAWLEVNDNLTALEKIRVLNNIFFKKHGFKGDTKNYYAAENSFINDVLINKKGNPLMLSAIYSIIGQSIDIPLYGVNLPSHFLVAYTDKFYNLNSESIEVENILFYINPFGQGDIHNIVELRKFLTNLKLESNDKFLVPCDNEIIVKRSLANLINIYKHSSENQLLEDYENLLSVFED